MMSAWAYMAVRATFPVIETSLEALVSPSLQLVKVTRPSYCLAVSCTACPSSYIHLPSTTVGAGSTVTM